jgi:uncharacterized protein YodC (DUF2158 family)
MQQTSFEREELQIGDMVVLNSGGPDTTVISVDGSEVTIEWKDESGPSNCTLPSTCVHRIDPARG